MYRLWGDIDRINNKWVSTSTKYLAYRDASIKFAEAGDTAFARKLLNTAKDSWLFKLAKNPKAAKLDIQSTEAKIQFAEGNYNKAANLYEDWAQLFEDMPKRFMIGTDFHFGRKGVKASKYKKRIGLMRRMLGTLDPGAARMIAHGNARGLISASP